MIDKKQLRELVSEVLIYFGLHSDSAVNLILGTIAQESRLGTYIKQLGGGKALGICQMEPATEKDIWDNYLSFKSDLRKRVELTFGGYGFGFNSWADLSYQIIMCRIHYLRIKEPLPPANDIPKLASYWKRYYNTVKGKGTEQEFIENYNRYII